MTRSYFEDCVNDWGELLNFCWDHEYEIDVDYEDSMEETISNDLSGIARNFNLREMKDFLNNLPLDAQFVTCRSYPDDWIEVDDCDFEYYKEDVLSWGDRNGVWEEEEEEEEEEEDKEEESGEEEERKDREICTDEIEEGCPIEELLQCGFIKMQAIVNGELCEREINQFI